MRIKVRHEEECGITLEITDGSYDMEFFCGLTKEQAQNLHSDLEKYLHDMWVEEYGLD